MDMLFCPYRAQIHYSKEDQALHAQCLVPVVPPPPPLALGFPPLSVYCRPKAGCGICVKTAKNMEMCPSANYAQEDMIFLPRIGMLPKLGNRAMGEKEESR